MTGDEPPPQAPAPLASVIVPTKNRARMLWDCFVGLSRQTVGRDRFEVILLDNRSSEDIAALAERARRDLALDVRYHRMAEDRGPVPARNFGATMLARAPILAFTDSDCRPTPRWLECGLAPFADPAVALVSGPVQYKPEQEPTLFSKMTAATGTERPHPTYPCANVFYRRDVFLAFGGFESALSVRDPFGRSTEAADTDLAWRVIEAGHGRAFAPQAVVQHEIERQSFWLWLIEPTRLLLVPALVRRHPRLREELLRFRLIFYPPMALLYAGALALPFLLWISPWALVAYPAALAAYGAVRERSLAPDRVAAFVGRFLLHLPRMTVMALTLVYGSLRYRSVVL